MSDKGSSSEIALGYDLGGTKVAVGVINRQGNVIEEVRAPVKLEEGRNAVICQLIELGQDFLKKYPRIERVGLASAGPLDPKTGFLLNPTNFVGPEGRWGIVPITALLSEGLLRPVVLENDAASAMLAEYWIGASRGFANSMILTLGTGLGTGIIQDGALLRSARGMHTEAGHLLLNGDDFSHRCGCGSFGCGESYLSGTGFVRRARAALNDNSLTGLELASRARQGDLAAIERFSDYAVWLARAVHNFNIAYGPEVVVLTGGFADTHDLFLEKTRSELEKTYSKTEDDALKIPALKISSLKNSAGIIGAGYIAFNHL